tara:strand:+ start:1051 stop:1260 length:210 start_codon:yes stop_codon:yes gene_type:complete
MPVAKVKLVWYSTKACDLGLSQIERIMQLQWLVGKIIKAKNEFFQYKGSSMATVKPDFIHINQPNFCCR